MKIYQAANPEMAVRHILQAAMEEKASDVHISPEEDGVYVRFRKDGKLSMFGKWPLSMAQGFSVRMKVLGGMNVGETRLPQDGSFSETADGVTWDFRISVMPTIKGETIVIRILSGAVDFIEKNHLGMTEFQRQVFEKRLLRKSGLVLTTGPTGSGKTSTLYAALKLVLAPEISAISIEDPVEYRIHGMTQVQVNEKAGLTFAKGLKALVRQDPDVVMIGEIRDRETAEIAVHAALTGHLVLSSLHTNDAVSAAARLTDMGIPPYLLAASLSLVISQRLAVKLEDEGKEEFTIGTEDIRRDFLPPAFLGKKGYKGNEKGRTGIFEMLEIGKDERKALHEKAGSARLSELMKQQGQKTIGEIAEKRMEEGMISPGEAAILYEIR